MISVVTPTYKTQPEVLARTWASLKAQTFTDWEWVVWDDTPNNYDVWRQLYGYAADERYRVSIHKSHVHSGSIGQLKRRASMVSEGNIIVELDHDDELTPNCLAEIWTAFDNPQIGFVYSDWCEILPNGMSGRYPEGWAFGYGSDYWSIDYGCWAMSAPAINSTTIRHIVSAPNHVRAWRSDVYRSLNGHNPKWTIADDYDLCVRTFLETRMVHIPKLLYKQHIGAHTAQRQQNDLIQRNVAEIAAFYDKHITARCEELGLD